VAGLFFPDFHEPDFLTGADPDADSPEFIDTLIGALNVPVLHGDTARALQNGDAFFPAMLKAIDEAERTVNFQCYIWESGSISDRFIAAFAGAAARGVEVRVLIDAFGAFKFKGDDRQRLRDSGCKLEFFRPIKWYNMIRVFKRTHQRAIVIDGRIGFTGGAAVADKWLGNADSEEHWRDSMTEVTGALVSGVQAAFGNDWVYCCGEILTGPSFYPQPPTGLVRPGASVGDDGAERPLGLAVVSSPSDAEQPIRICNWLAFRAARRSLWISNSYFIPDKRLRKAVTDRARAGVDVRILVPGDKTDAKPVRLAGHTHYEELMQAGVRVYEYQPTMMHAKVVVIDGTWSIVGSANMDERSMELNEENVLAIRDTGLARAFEEGLEADAAVSREIDLETWCRRSLWARIKERCSRALIEQY
jgi:cardiolipin synthase